MVKEDITPASSYLEISKVVSFLEQKISDLQLDIHTSFVTWVALHCAGLNENDLQGYKCRTNQYLQNALRVQQLPYPDSINNEKVETRQYNILCSAIDSSNIERQDGLSFKEAVSHVAKITLEFLRDNGSIKGEDKHFSSLQKQKLSEDGYLIIPSVLSDEDVEKLSVLTLFIAEEEDTAGVSYRYGGEGNRLQRHE